MNPTKPDQRTHHLAPSRVNTHGYFSRELPPALTIESGDTVIYTTLGAGWHRDPDPVTAAWSHLDRVHFHNPETDRGHALQGPVFISEATPGSVLEIEILEVVTGSWGWSLGGGRCTELNTAIGIDSQPYTALWWHLDRQTGAASAREGFRIRMRPFLGVMGMPPDEPGEHETGPPRTTGGNIDCKELVAGTTLYLPVAVDGGLFSAGDGHAVQGDGEVSGVAIECPMDRVALRLTVRKDLAFESPRAWTPEAWITFGFDADLNRATTQAVVRMVDLICETYEIDRRTAISLASLAADVHVTQVVNGVKGAHVMLAHSAIDRIPPT